MDSLPIVEILLSDLERVRDVLAGCITYFTADDVQRAQLSFREIKKSPMTNSLEEAKERLDGILADYLFEQYQTEKDGIIVIDAHGDDDDEEEEEIEGELSANPLGTPKFSTRIEESQGGRR